MNGIGNGPVVVLAFLSSFTVSGAALLDLVVRVLVMLLVGLIGKGIDALVKVWIERRRERALKSAGEPAGLKGDAD